jgi:spore germination cell wall hydrolase CwlJ-like protein
MRGQHAVAEVIVNRAEDHRFPNSVCGVIRQDKGPRAHDCQFSFMCDGKPEVIHEPKAFETAKKVATQVLYQDGPEYADGALFFLTTGVSPSWTRSLDVTARYGDHVFMSY